MVEGILQERYEKGHIRHSAEKTAAVMPIGGVLEYLLSHSFLPTIRNVVPSPKMIAQTSILSENIYGCGDVCDCVKEEL